LRYIKKIIEPLTPYLSLSFPLIMLQSHRKLQYQKKAGGVNGWAFCRTDQHIMKALKISLISVLSDL
jgi:hypothetical protein